MVKSCFSNEKKFNLDGPDDFQKYWHAKHFLEKNFSTRNSGGGFLMICGGASHLQENLTTICQWSIKSSRLCEDAEGFISRGVEWIFQQDNATIYKASITKKYLLEQKIRLLDHPECSPDLNHIENL